MLRRRFAPLAGACLTLAAITAGGVPAAAQDSTTRAMERAPESEAPRRHYIGGGVAFVPEYPGASSYRAAPLPDVSLRFGQRFFVNTRNGAGVYLLEDDRFTLGTSLYFRPGRDQDDDARLNGLGDIDAAVQLRAFGTVRAGQVIFGTTLAQDLGGSDGLTVDLTASLPYVVDERLTLTPMIGTRYGDSDYMSTWFGVSPTQSQRSGLGEHNASSGFMQVSALLGARYRITDNWSTNGFFGAARLLGDAADSPAVEDKTQFIGGLSVGYAF